MSRGVRGCGPGARRALECVHVAGDDAEENQARRRGLGEPVTAAHAPPPAGHHAEEARQGAAPEHRAQRVGRAAGAAAAGRHLNLAQRAPHLAPAPASGSGPARAPGARCSAGRLRPRGPHANSHE